MTVSLVMIDIGLHHAQRGIKYILEQREFEAEERKRKRLERDSATINRHKTFSCKK